MQNFSKLIILTLCCVVHFATLGQQDSLSYKEEIAVAARVFKDSIQLRWAPLKYSSWQLANVNGYTIERFIMVRDGQILQQPVKSILNGTPIRALPETQWVSLVSKSKYHAIAAQALYGDRFEVDLSKSDIFTIVNKVKENEQRFAFALFSADMSPSVAKACGLWFTDKNVKENEKYLYRIIVNSKEDIKGSIYIGPDDDFPLLAPENLIVKIEGAVASLRWDNNLSAKYTAYIVERSMDGKVFSLISDEPIITVSQTDVADSRYEYAMDSVPDVARTYHYRVRGLTPFGEQSPPSQISSVQGFLTVSDVPYISEGVNINNTLIRLKWDFDTQYNSLIKGFIVERSSKPKGLYEPVSTQSPIPPDGRTFDDRSPMNVNYYKVTALGLNGERFSSPIYLANLVDSIPPTAPIGLTGTINQNGVVSLSWKPNNEEDIYGYRVYRANFKQEEMSQITSEPINRTTLIDTVNLSTLNREILYSIMAIDRSQNHSKLSAVISVPLPDKIKPQPVGFLPVKSDEHGIHLSWTRSGSTDVLKYAVYRKSPGQKEWQKLVEIPAGEETTYNYKDETSESGINYAYTIVAIDFAGLESDPAEPVSAAKIDTNLKPKVQWKRVKMMEDKAGVMISWDYEESNVASFRLYKAVGDEGVFELYRTIGSGKREYIDVIRSGKNSKYKILAIFKNGVTSELSDELIVDK